MEKYLKDTYYFDFKDSKIQELISEFKTLESKEKIGGLFLKIRDGWRYNPFTVFSTKEEYRASVLASRKEAHCIDKSTLYIAGLRALEIPARLRLAKVVNHIAVERLTEKLGTPYIAPHGIIEVYSNDRWLKASNAFNKSLCEKYDVDPLYFDGTEDAMIQAFNRKDERYMEYVEDCGSFDDVPFDFIVDTFKKNYPQLAGKLNKGMLEI